MIKISTAEGDIELTGEEEAAFLASRPLPGEPSYSFGKSIPWRRMTDSEAETMEGVIAAAPARLRNIYAAASELNSGDELWATLRGYLVAQFGEDRTSELLAPV